MKVLVVEDTPEILDLLLEGLKIANMTPESVVNGRDADLMLETANRCGEPYDAVVMDLTLPGLDGLEIVRRMRVRGDLTPVLILSARSTVEQRVGGLEAGADDYLPKPFELPELFARIRALGRRRTNWGVSNPVLGSLTFDSNTGDFLVGDQGIKLSPRPRAILEALFRRRGTVVSKSFLQGLVAQGASTEAIDIQISRLRKRLVQLGAGVSIVTHYGSGYSIQAQTQDDGSDQPVAA